MSIFFVIIGEAFPGSLLAWKSKSNNTRIFNFYGLTELSCWATLCEISFDQSSSKNDLIGPEVDREEKRPMFADVAIGEAMADTELDFRQLENG